MSNQVSIKAYAKRAKRRMTSGYWDKVRKEREEYIQNNPAEDAHKIIELYARRLMREIYFSLSSDKDEEMYRKVCNILDKDGYVCNPISQLIDHGEYDNLDFAGRQTYLIKLTDKYKELRERYEREHDARRRIYM